MLFNIYCVGFILTCISTAWYSDVFKKETGRNISDFQVLLVSLVFAIGWPLVLIYIIIKVIKDVKIN